VPVYLHYCGGELEKVNYLVKTGSCCGSEDESADDDGCCRDEGAYVQNHTDFNLKLLSYNFFIQSSSWSHITSSIFSLPENLKAPEAKFLPNGKPPFPKITEAIVCTSVLRI
jgi:hypothetical protein